MRAGPRAFLLIALIALPVRATVEVVLTSGRVLTADRVAREGDDIVLISAAGTVRLRAAQVQAVRDASAADARGLSVSADVTPALAEGTRERRAAAGGPAWAR